MSFSNGGREMSRAEKFEDEKRRIIDSCFMKKDDDGSTLETYITHIRIVEFSSSPTSPPPPDARGPNSEKARVIIVAVRKSGRVRIHKSKENTNGTFSIGKTWFLDDLSAIESFTSPTSNPDFQQWAGNVGFIVTLGKPYYWQAQTDKEKKFFIASLIKIFSKYTGGRTPNLTGFDQRELDQVLGGAQAPRRQERPPPPRPSLPDMTPSSGNASISSGYNGSLGVQTPIASSFTTDRGVERVPSRSPLLSNGRSSPARSVESGRPSNDQTASLRRLASNNQSQDSVATSLAARSEDASSLPPRSRNGINGGAGYGAPVPLPVPVPPPQQSPPTEERPPERKRPPMDPLRPLPTDRDLVPAPLMSPGMRREPVVPVPPRTLGDQVVRQEDSRGDPAPAAGPPSPPAVTPVSLNPKIPPPRAEDSGTPAESPVDPDAEDRPGLGPMIKGDTLWKRAAAKATAYSAFNSAFKPRPGGAAERLRQAQEKSTDGPDGITGVVPAPPRPTSAPKSPDPTPTPAPIPELRPKAAERRSGNGMPEVKVSVPNSGSRPSSLQANASLIKEKEKKAAEEKAAAAEEERRSIVAGNDSKYFATLGIDPSILTDKTSEFAKWLDYFGWVPGDQMRAKGIDEIRVDIDRELNKAQAGGWLARFQEEDERVEAIKRGVDLAINECDELDNLLTLYSVELSTLAEDIAYIEAQGQGLQVQTANQKLLKKELESLLQTCAISQEDLRALRVAPLEAPNGVEAIEDTLVTLYKAMLKIDPTMGNGDETRRSEDESQSLGLNSDYGKMRIVQEKKEMYMAESSQFMKRLVEFMIRRFDEVARETKIKSDSPITKKLSAEPHQEARKMLWMYSPLILYARDVDLDNWNRILQIYQERIHPVYKVEFKDGMEAWKKNARRLTGDEGDILFTSQQEKKEEGLATTARKLTVKRSQTLARSLRSPLGGEGSSRANVDKSTPDGRSLPYEVYAGVLDDLLPLVEMEQNFIVDFFHASTLEQMDFPEVVVLSKPQDRGGGDLRRHRLMEPDRELARRVTRAMEVIFQSLEANLQQLMDWVLGMDPLQGVGILGTLERKMAATGQSNQDFLNNMLQKLHGNLEVKFKKFVDDQVRAIEETKVKIKKRKGIIHFIRIFPQFLNAVENMLAGVDPNLGVRRMVDREYDRIIKTMFDSLKIIARENPTAAMAMGGASTTVHSGAASIMTATTVGSSADPEDKEALNFHILLIENMHHYLDEVNNSHNLEVLDDWRDAAQQELAEHVNLYVNAVVRRPLGKLLEYLENIEAQLASGKLPSMIAAQPSNSKTTFNKVLGGYDAKEVRKGIETLRKRVEKHFSDGAEDPMVVMNLIAKMLKECEKFYADVELRIGAITTDVYGGDVLFEWPRAEVRAAFSSWRR